MIQPSDLEPEIRTLPHTKTSSHKSGGRSIPYPQPDSKSTPTQMSTGAVLSEQNHISSLYQMPRSQGRKVNTGVADDEPNSRATGELATKLILHFPIRVLYQIQEEPVLAVSPV